MRSALYFFFTSFLLLFLGVSFVYAQTPAPPLFPGGGQQVDAPDVTPVRDICAFSITNCVVYVGTVILRILLALVLIAAVIFFIIGGVTYIFGGPDPAKRARARDYLIYSLIGVIAAFLAFTAVGALRDWLIRLSSGSR